MRRTMLAMNAFFLALLAAGMPHIDAVAATNPSAAIPAPQAAEEVDPFVATYHEAAAAGDADRLAELWRSAPERVLVTIDADLEGSLSLVEKWTGPMPENTKGKAVQEDMKKVAALHERAVFGARVAARAIDRPLLADYAVSFTGWTPEQQAQFRKGQQTFGQAREALGAGELDRALELAQKTAELAEPLGDWWGTAMGRSLAARVAWEQGNSELAVLESARARSIHHAIGLAGSEASDLIVLAEASLALGNRQRAAEAVRAGLELAPEGSRPRAALEELAERTQDAE